jgi:hypothetical protein
VNYNSDIEAKHNLPGQVLAAFFASATITIVAVLAAYLSDSLDPVLLSNLDKSVISRSNTIWCKLWGPQVGNDADRDDAENRDRRREVFMRFILAMSDQQLVTGLAILISGVSNQYKITNYEFQVILGLAWFSTTTHLATLSALRQFFRARKPLCHIRVFGMIIVLILLIYAFFLTNFDSFDLTVPIQCMFSVPGYEAPPPVWQDPDWLLGFLSFLYALFLILWGYYVRVQALYSNHTVWLHWRLWRIRRQDRGTGAIMDTDISELSNDELLKEYKAYIRADSLSRLSKPFTWKQRILYRLRITNFRDSFFLSIPGIAFSYSYGITQAATYRWQDPPTLSDGSSTMGFGQIMPILLLVLPLFAACEAYYGNYFTSA